MTTNFWNKKFRNYHFALGYADGYSKNPKSTVPKSAQKKYDDGFKLGCEDRIKHKGQ